MDENEIKEAIDKTLDKMTQKLKKERLLIVHQTAIEKTKNDVINFKNALDLLNDDETNQITKKQLALFSINMQRALKNLKNTVSDIEFVYFYSFYFNNQSIRELAWNNGIDEKTVKRAIHICTKSLSILLYPNLVIDEIFY